LRMGGFNLNASTGVTANYLSNARYTSTNEEGDTILTATPSVTLNSIWSRHALNLGTRVAANRYSKFDKDNTTDWTLIANGRYDISGRARVGANLSIVRGTEGRNSNETPTNLVRPVRTNQYTGGLSFETEFNRLRFLGNVSASKYKYNGLVGTFDQHQRDVLVYDTSGRLDYAVSPDTSVYVYVAANRREHENVGTFDSDGHIVAAGARFDFSTLITGEAEVGTMKQNYKNFASKDNNAYYRANVVWSPTPLTSITGRLGRMDSVTAAIGAFGVLRTEASFTVDHELLRNLMVSANASHNLDEFKGVDRDDKRNAIGVTGVYYLSNRLSVNTEVRHEELTSNGAQAFKSYKNNSVRIGLVLNY
jgi:hypothetical protein